MGPTPVVGVPIDPWRAHRIRVEQDGYRTRDLVIEPDASAAVRAELEPVGPDEAVRPEPPVMPGPAGGEPDDAPAAPGLIRVSSQPPAATVWILVGITPARIPSVATARRQELRIGKDGYLPAFVTVDPKQFGAGGEARLSTSLAPRPRP